MQVFQNLKIHLVFSGQEVFLAGDVSLPLHQAGIPPHITGFRQSATWIVQVLRYFEEEQRMFCQVLEYHTGNLGFPASQHKIPFLSSINRISFARIDTAALLRCMVGEEGIEALMKEHIQKLSKKTAEDVQIEYESPENLEESDKTTQIPPAAPKPPVVREIFRTCQVMVKDLRFRFGGVSFLYYLHETGKKEEIFIANPELREEFDAVKNYFSNVLKTKNIKVRMNCILKDRELEKIVARSAEIERINKEMIDTVKFELVKDMGKKRFWQDTESNLFTADDMLDEFLHTRGGRVPFFSNDQELFEHLLSIKDTKHYRHLRYLSSLHAHQVMRLRFVVSPFSFVFLLEGEKEYYIVWETLDTAEATYIWPASKEKSKLKMQLNKIEDIINTVKVQGKMAYLNTARDEQFRRIIHEYGDPLHGFVKWKGELDSIIA